MKDINCDLGEGEPAMRTRALMKHVTSVNIACGGHAGDMVTIRRCLDLCREFGVRAGAHPGFPDRENFGRKELPLSVRELETLLLQQMSALSTLAAAGRVRPHHVKLHGALYHVVERDSGLARAYVRLVRECFSGWRIYASPFGTVMREAGIAGVNVWREVFADRAYLATGALAPRGEPGAVVCGAGEIRARTSSLIDRGIVVATDGTPLPVTAETLCVHADSPGAVRVAKILAEAVSVPRRAGR